jgi:5'(3')-deoxyribonucleotidase
MRILLDQDQVICCWLERLLEWWNEDKGTHFTREDVKDWAVTDTLGPGSEDFIRSSMRYPEMYRDLEEVPGAIAGVEKLIDDGHDVLIVTAVPKCAGIVYHGKLEWLRRKMRRRVMNKSSDVRERIGEPFFDLKNFIACQRKELISGDLLVDDGVHNLIPFKESGRMTVVFDAPWNRSYTGATKRVYGWPDLLAFIDEVVRQTRASDEQRKSELNTKHVTYVKDD